MAERRPSKPMTRVRFPSPAPFHAPSVALLRKSFLLPFEASWRRCRRVRRFHRHVTKAYFAATRSRIGRRPESGRRGDAEFRSPCICSPKRSPSVTARRRRAVASRRRRWRRRPESARRRWRRRGEMAWRWRRWWRRRHVRAVVHDRRRRWRWRRWWWRRHWRAEKGGGHSGGDSARYRVAAMMMVVVFCLCRGA